LQETCSGSGTGSVSLRDRSIGIRKGGSVARASVGTGRDSDVRRGIRARGVGAARVEVTFLDQDAVGSGLSDPVGILQSASWIIVPVDARTPVLVRGNAGAGVGRVGTRGKSGARRQGITLVDIQTSISSGADRISLHLSSIRIRVTGVARALHGSDGDGGLDDVISARGGSAARSGSTLARYLTHVRNSSGGISFRLGTVGIRIKGVARALVVVRGDAIIGGRIETDGAETAVVGRANGNKCASAGSTSDHVNLRQSHIGILKS